MSTPSFKQVLIQDICLQRTSTMAKPEFADPERRVHAPCTPAAAESNPQMTEKPFVGASGTHE